MAYRMNRESREEEYLRRMKELGYVPSLAGMDDEDMEWELQRMDGRRQEGRPEFSQVRPGVDRNFAERIFRMFARPFDRNWQMPDTNGPEYIAEPKRYGGIVGEGDMKYPNVGPVVYGPNKGKPWPTDHAIAEREKWQEELRKKVKIIPGSLQSQPPVKIIVGGKEIPVEVGPDGGIKFGF